jgi:phage/plasmid-associated DNA primase
MGSTLSYFPAPFVPQVLTTYSLKLIPFLIKFAEDTQDQTLQDTLRSEAQGILAWIVRGVREYMSRGLYEAPPVKAAIGAYRRQMDPVTDFLDECCDIFEGEKNNGDKVCDNRLTYRWRYQSRQYCGVKGSVHSFSQMGFGGRPASDVAQKIP